jgi:phosphatidylserine/phosphatidylglycerophosphate/cardiolipin synthase-like enzyme
MDAETVRKASRARWGDLLEAGVEIFEYQPTMYHCKVMIVDGLWLSVGSTNFDSRSFSLNDEANLNIFDAAFASRQVAVFQQFEGRPSPRLSARDVLPRASAEPARRGNPTRRRPGRTHRGTSLGLRFP